MIDKKTLNFNLPIQLEEDLGLYASLYGIKKPASIAYILNKQIQHYLFNKEIFLNEMNQRRYKNSSEYSCNKFSIKVSILVHDYIFEINKCLNTKTTETVVNLIRNELNTSFYPYINDNKDVLSCITQEHLNNIPISNVTMTQLYTCSDSIGISLNMLIAQIIGDYTRNHYNDYSSQLY